ncbi:MAG: thioredoxin domain-containing protein [Deltaproteobacteria bacterium]|nr:thioredoxin domain-containing protein [Deltaproteobacteria bacterium]
MNGQRLNRLQFARSPYLLQHADNPVEWYEWGDAAFEKARSANLPVFLSIGYATCHWCHVMAHESFADEEVAALLNRHFVCIKVDREERPDIDDFYMAVSQVLTGSGGWPLNIFMTPDRRPFMAMTYLPKRGRGEMAGFMELLANIAALWRQRPDMIEKNCKGILEALGNISRPAQREGVEPEELSRKAMEQLAGIYDWELGGFGNAPKFPMPIYLSWLIEEGHRGNRQALKMALHTLSSIRSGGIWDQLEGGLHRYAVDRKWLVPHFEKMLYDQAQVALAALEAFQVGGDDFFLGMAEEIFSCVERDFASAEGGFCSALDADTEGVEGKFYVWDRQEVEECLGPDASLFCRFYDVTASGNFEGHAILNMPEGLQEFCEREGLDPARTEEVLARCRLVLLKRRETRVRPFRDNKVVTAWNGLMIAALARGGAVGGKPEYSERAARAAAFILEKLRRKDGRLLRSFLGGASDIPAFLEDYACLGFGLLELFEATLDKRWLDEALRLAEEALRLFRDPANGMFATIGLDAEQMPARFSLDHDGVTPSSMSLMLQVLARLSHTCERPDLADFAHQALDARLGPTEQQPLAHLGVLRALAMLEREPDVITFSGALGEQELSELLTVAKRRCLYNCVFRREPDPPEPAGVRVCGAGACHPAIRDAAGLEALLRRLATGG